MFGRNKKENKNDQLLANNNIQVIPNEFYGTADPVIHYEKSSTGASGDNLKNVNIMDNNTKIPNAFFASLGKNKRIIFIVLTSIIFLLAVVGIVWYYLGQAGIIGKTPADVVVEKTEDNNIETTNPVNEDNNINSEDSQITTGTLDLAIVSTTIDNNVNPQTPDSLLEQPIDFPGVILTNSADVDSDSLTDTEEELFDTDSGVWDTDSDGYYDGQEMVNLYNPKGIAPVKLIDSGLVQDYINPIWQYRVYYPIAWQQGEVDKGLKQSLFSAITGDFVEILVDNLQPGESFNSWFARRAQGQKYEDLLSFINLFKENGYKRKDGLVAYFVQNNNVYIMIYHPGVTGFIPFRHVMEMMVTSFRPSKTIVEIPDQVALPPVPSYEDVSTGTQF
ncbi:MAG TPA: hypothetical protein DEB09_05765 [Candidatus Magasanikbacteria bacterium]|nr:hypothetical protein [Candidatus Magasanikbacteria bacterium]